MDFCGRFGREASRFLSKLGDIVASYGRVRKGAFVLSVHQELSCALCLRNVQCTSNPRFPQPKPWVVRSCPYATAWFTKAVRCGLADLSALVTGFTCFFAFPFLFAQLSVVVPLLLRLHLDLDCKFPFGVDGELLLWCLPFYLLVLLFVGTQTWLCGLVV